MDNSPRCLDHVGGGLKTVTTVALPAPLRGLLQCLHDDAVTTTPTASTIAYKDTPDTLTSSRHGQDMHHKGGSVWAATRSTNGEP